MPYQLSPKLRSILENLPVKPGVYLMKDEAGKILYIGKAKRLRDRVRSYFGNASDLEQKTRRLRARVTDIQFIVVENEVKALILEEDTHQAPPAHLQRPAQRRQALSLYPRELAGPFPKSGDHAPSH